MLNLCDCQSNGQSERAKRSVAGRADNPVKRANQTEFNYKLT
ncbi:MAG: hypothetical protein PHR96_01705 [Clostridia bacterium]|nr:hypothetical protein [Clostridia bacterium]